MRSIPPVDQCLQIAAKSAILAGYSPAQIKRFIQRAQSAIRERIVNDSKERGADRAAIAAAIVASAEREAAESETRIAPVVNATGVVLHTNLGRAILAEQAIDAVASAAANAIALEFDLERGDRGDRDSIIESELCDLTGAEAATVVNNNAAAVLIALNTLAPGREVIVSRGELVEIGGSFRIPDVIAKSGAIMREVGTTNRTHRADFEAAIDSSTAMLLKVHPSNYTIAGFTAEVGLAAMAEIAHTHELILMEDLGAGALVDLSEFGLPREPIVSERIEDGADIVTFSGDKLIGGPQAGLIVGRRAIIDRIKRNPLKRALRCDKLTLAALHATLRIYMRPAADIVRSIPAIRHLARPIAELRSVANQVREIVAARLGPEFNVEVCDTESEAGSGALAESMIASAGVSIAHPRISADAIAAMFRRSRIIGRISHEKFILDMRTIENPASLAVAIG
jgi:L-seryl-tRNA(Ser) seleniumtransferase